MEQDALVKTIKSTAGRIKKSSLHHRKSLHKNIPTFKPADWKMFRDDKAELDGQDVVRALDGVDRLSADTWGLLHRLNTITGEDFYE